MRENETKETDRKLLLRAMANELSTAERAGLDDRLAAEPGLRSALMRMTRVEALVRETPRSRFRPGFTGRVLARIASAEGPRRLSAALALGFRRLVPAALVVILALLAHNLLTEGPAARSALEAVLGLQPLTLEVAYDLDAVLYGTAP